MMNGSINIDVMTGGSITNRIVAGSTSITLDTNFAQIHGTQQLGNRITYVSNNGPIMGKGAKYWSLTPEEDGKLTIDVVMDDFSTKTAIYVDRKQLEDVMRRLVERK